MNKNGVTRAKRGLKGHVGAVLGLSPAVLAMALFWTPFEEGSVHPIVDLGSFWGLFYALLKAELVEVKMTSKHVSKMLKRAPEKWYTIADTLSSKVLCLLGARLRIYPFSVESGFFLILPRRHFLSKMSKITQILYILSGPCMVYSKCLDFLFFSSTKV